MLKFKKCTKCLRGLPLGRFPKDAKYAGGYKSWCKKCISDYQYDRLKERFKVDCRLRLLTSSKNNAKNKGLVHSIQKEDIVLVPTCIYLGVPIDYSGEGRTQYSASIDRIDSTKGYIKGNVQVISDLANRMKQNATPEQLIMFAKGVLALHCGQVS